MRPPIIWLSPVMILLCSFASAQWIQLGLAGRSIGDIAVGSSGLFAVTSDSGSVHRSTDGGVTWIQNVQSGARDIAVAPNGLVFMVKGIGDWSFDENLYRSTDGGTTWSSRSMTEYFPATGGSMYIFRMNVAVGPTGTVFCGAECSNQWLTYTAFLASADDGFSWTAPWTSSWYGADSLGGGSFAFSGHHVITLGYLHGVTSGEHPGALLLSSDNGQSWIFKGNAPAYTRSVGLCPNGYVLCGTPGYLLLAGGLYLSTDSVASWSSDSGGSWRRVSTVVPEVLLSLGQGSVLVGTGMTGICLFSDCGDSLKALNEGLTDLHVHTLAIDAGGYIYVGTDNGIWRRPLSEVVTSMPFSSGDVPGELTLFQNYPNPFNPVTNIRFQMSDIRNLKLAVYDLLGREVAVLVNEKRGPGSYEVRFDGSGLSSGVYLYRMRAGDYVTSKKMLVLK